MRGAIPPPPAVAAGYTTLTFNEDCSANSINYNGVYTKEPGSPAQPRWFTANNQATPLTAAQAFISGGVLNLLQDNSGYGLGLVSAPTRLCAAAFSQPGSLAVANAGGLVFQYGYYEATYKVSGVAGTSPPAWWLSTSAVGGTIAYPEIEIDIIENNGGTCGGCAVHDWTASGTSINTTFTTITPPAGFSFANYNTYGCLWSPTECTFYVNDVLVKGPINAGSTPPLSNFPRLTAQPTAGNTGVSLTVGAGATIPMFIGGPAVGGRGVRVWQSP